MVVIEPHKSEETPESTPSSTKTTAGSTDDTTSNAAAAPSALGDASDGFETASERDVSDNEDDNDGNREDHHKGQQEQDKQAEQQEQKGGDSYEDALNDDELKQGKYNETIKECTKALELNPSYIKALVRRGEAHEKLEHYEEAIVDMKKILELDPSNDQARKAICCLEPLAAEKREKMKEEMIAKMKELGNSVLGRFGMSVDNFKAVQDPNTGSYSISFQR
ncbi:hypothetical protein SLEP1_g28567 [Rubroshorea leprosula]|uniref:Tetratricopeptide repeat protein 1 n=1 Tax=Rubroshorea leprosula TaxID=152421 RepID=A0AAV5K6A4_9ROSI|nr:hypothetical protein SLEP1_g28567 [Rubroshorea leprosula]